MKCQKMFYSFSLRSFFLLMGAFSISCMASAGDVSVNDNRVDALLSQMTLDEKVGQMVQADMLAIKDKQL